MHKADGLTLRFTHPESRSDYYVIFNVRLDRQRDSKKHKAGTPYPRGQFWVSKRYEFFRFWQRTGLKVPPRLSAFNDYMGNLAQLTYQADIARLNRLDAKTLRPFYPDEQSLISVGTNKVQTLAEHQTNKAQTASPNRDIAGCPDIRAFGDQLIACSEDHEKSKQGDALTSTVARKSHGVSNQSVDEWLSEYSRHDACSNPSRRWEYK
tara:strand:- start:25 stop:648 length:624 start_codon:yes stop_codon:yes gene_type:complete